MILLKVYAPPNMIISRLVFVQIKTSKVLILAGGNCFLIAEYAHARGGILLFPIQPYTSLVNSRYETLCKKLREK